MKSAAWPTPASTGTSDGRSRSEKRASILDAATRVFARTGYHGARISDIAREAGIAYGLVYHYFRNKEEILDRIFAERWAGFLDAVEGIAGADTPVREKLVGVAAIVLNAYRLRPDWVKVLVLEIQRSSRIAQPDQMRSVGRFFQLITRVLRDGQDRGELREDLDPEVAAYLFIGGLELVITASVLEVLQVEAGREREYYDGVARTLGEIFLNGLAKGGA